MLLMLWVSVSTRTICCCGCLVVAPQRWWASRAISIVDVLSAGDGCGHSVDIVSRVDTLCTGTAHWASLDQAATSTRPRAEGFQRWSVAQF